MLLGKKMEYIFCVFRGWPSCIFNLVCVRKYIVYELSTGIFSPWGTDVGIEISGGSSKNFLLEVVLIWQEFNVLECNIKNHKDEIVYLLMFETTIRLPLLSVLMKKRLVSGLSRKDSIIQSLNSTMFLGKSLYEICPRTNGCSDSTMWECLLVSTRISQI